MRSPQFPKSRPYVTGRMQRRYIRKHLSETETLVLDERGNQRSQYGPGGFFGVYFWKGNEWQLDGIYNSRESARKAAARIRLKSR